MITLIPEVSNAAGINTHFSLCCGLLGISPKCPMTLQINNFCRNESSKRDRDQMINVNSQKEKKKAKTAGPLVGQGGQRVF